MEDIDRDKFNYAAYRQQHEAISELAEKIRQAQEGLGGDKCDLLVATILACVAVATNCAILQQGFDLDCFDDDSFAHIGSEVQRKLRECLMRYEIEGN